MFGERCQEVRKDMKLKKIKNPTFLTSSHTLSLDSVIVYLFSRIFLVCIQVFVCISSLLFLHQIDSYHSPDLAVFSLYSFSLTINLEMCHISIISNSHMVFHSINDVNWLIIELMNN